MRRFRQTNGAPVIRSAIRKQNGMVLMVMLIIVVIGAAAVFVGSLRSAAVQIERDRVTANALAQAREALIGYAVTDSNHPGDLPCPDVDNDGSLTMNVDYIGGNCTNTIGRLPWKTLGLPELRDGAGEHLWYTVSKPFAAIGTPHVNSDTQGTLTVGGTTSASNVIAIVFAPGSALPGQSRSAATTVTCAATGTTMAESLCATNYLEGSNAILSTWASPNLNYQSADTSSTFNDRLSLITSMNLIPLIEKRIGRETKSCLDNYALAHANTYPWAAPVTDTTNYAGVTNTLFGRLPKSSTYSAKVQLLLDDIAALQLALNNYSANPNSTNRQILIDAGNKLYADADGATKFNANPLTSDDIAKARDLGDKTVKQIPPLGASSSTVQAYVNDIQTSEIDRTLTNFAEDGVTPGWSSGCTLVSPGYWDDWKNMVFYQIASGNQPGGTGCTSGTCLTINGTGSYRAAVIVAGKMRAGQISRNPAAVSDYLEGLNQTGKTPIPTTTSFETYRATDATYTTINDLVLCLDGRNNCK